MERARTENECENLQQKLDIAEDKSFQLMDKLEVFLIKKIFLCSVPGGPNKRLLESIVIFFFYTYKLKNFVLQTTEKCSKYLKKCQKA